MDNEKYERLSLLCSYLAGAFSAVEKWPESLVGVRIEEAAALARELFPPMAKPLVWELTDAWRAGQYRITQTHGGIWWVTHPDACSFKGDLDTAKAACEARHQARFLELLA